MYRQLFLGETPLRKELQADSEASTKAAGEKVAVMTEEKKLAEFNRIMGRTQRATTQRSAR